MGTSVVATGSMGTTTTPMLVEAAAGRLTIVAQGVSTNDISEVVQSVLATHLGTGGAAQIQVAVTHSRRLQERLGESASSGNLMDVVVWWQVSFVVRVLPVELVAVRRTAEGLRVNRLSFEEDLGVSLSPRAKDFGVFSKSFSVSGFTVSLATTLTTTLTTVVSIREQPTTADPTVPPGDGDASGSPCISPRRVACFFLALALTLVF